MCFVQCLFYVSYAYKREVLVLFLQKLLVAVKKHSSHSRQSQQNPDSWFSNTNILCQLKELLLRFSFVISSGPMHCIVIFNFFPSVCLPN